ncbi:MAG: heat-inducible transcriptional repressor HrcA [Clostridiales bacterium]|jgi:heat-inducible transcriptional repressor|nr:heat-inducible transcriptional repressor HrcA [Eubacteriales bacterium]MDH7565498.1 heat-inducible transcriptional repressor HrcA [Clostridiales bacterium]
MFLDDRKRRILRAIIDDYIDTAEPIGSRTIARKHELGLSSATIRNEMADLEEMGYLAQPHTSAGRIPSDKGYRLYVDNLMGIRELTLEEIESIKEAMEVRINELGQLIRQASVILSRITKYTSMAITPQMKKSILRTVQVVPIESSKALVIVVTNAGIVRNCMMKIPEKAEPQDLVRVSNILSEKLCGCTIEQINQQTIKDVEHEIGISKELLLPVLDGVSECIGQIDNPEVYLEGTTNIFNYPEFRDIMKAKGFLNVLDEKDVLYKLLNSHLENDSRINVQIGTENELDEIKDCSLVTTTYRIGDIVIGSMGVIGPTRMEYPKVISSMNYIRNQINRQLDRIVGQITDDS